MTLVRVEAIRAGGEWGNRSPRNIGFEYVNVRDHRGVDGRGCVAVWAEGHALASVILERFAYGNASDYEGERDQRQVHLSALGNACAVADHVAKRGSLHHIPRQFGGWGR